MPALTLCNGGCERIEVDDDKIDGSPPNVSELRTTQAVHEQTGMPHVRQLLVTGVK